MGFIHRPQAAPYRRRASWSAARTNTGCDAASSVTASDVTVADHEPIDVAQPPNLPASGKARHDVEVALVLVLHYDVRMHLA